MSMDTVRLIPFDDLLDFAGAVRRMRESQSQWIKLRGEKPHMNLEPLYQLVRRHEAEVDRRVREMSASARKVVTSLFAEGGVR